MTEKAKAMAPGRRVREASRKLQISATALARRARDPRSVRSRQAVLEAATALFVEVGHAGFSIHAVVRATGIAKTTIYRHWPTQGHLLAAVVARLAEQFEIPDRGDLRQDLIEHFMVYGHSIFNDPRQRALQTLPGLLQAAQHEPGLINVVNFTMSKLLEVIRVMIDRAHARGELRPDRDIELMVRVLYGAMSARRLLNEDPSDDEIVAMIDLVLDGIRAP